MQDQEEVRRWVGLIGEAVDRLGFIAIIAFMLLSRVATGSVIARAWAEYERAHQHVVLITWGHNLTVTMRGWLDRAFLFNGVGVISLFIFMLSVAGQHNWKVMLTVLVFQLVVVMGWQFMSRLAATSTKRINVSLRAYLALTPGQRVTRYGTAGSPVSLLFAWVVPTILHGIFLGLWSKILCNVYGVSQWVIIPMETLGMTTFTWGIAPIILILVAIIFLTSDGRDHGRWFERLLQIGLAIFLPGVTLQNVRQWLPITDEAEVSALHRAAWTALAATLSFVFNAWALAYVEDWLPVWGVLMMMSGVATLWRVSRVFSVKSSRSGMLQGMRVVGGEGGPYRARVDELDEEAVALDRDSQRQMYAGKWIFGVFAVKRALEITLAVMGVPFGISLFQPVVMGIKMLVFGPSPGEDLPTDPFNGVGVTRAGEALTSLNGMALTYMVVAVAFVFAVAWALKKALSGRGERTLNFVKWGMVVVVLCVFGAKVLKQEPIRLTENQTINTAYQQAAGRVDHAHATVVNRVSTAVDSAVQPAAPRPATPPPVVQQPTVTVETPPARTGTRRVTRRRSSGGASALQDDMALFGQ